LRILFDLACKINPENPIILSYMCQICAILIALQRSQHCPGGRFRRELRIDSPSEIHAMVPHDLGDEMHRTSLLGQPDSKGMPKVVYAQPRMSSRFPGLGPRLPSTIPTAEAVGMVENIFGRLGHGVDCPECPLG